MKKRLKIVENDAWLAPAEPILERRHKAYLREMDRIGDIVSFSNNYEYLGFHYDERLKGWWFREWLPKAKTVFIYGDFNDWNRTTIPLGRGENGVWEYFFDDRIFKGRIVNGSRYKLFIKGHNGEHERINAYAVRVIEDPHTHKFTPVVNMEPPFDWGKDKKIKPTPLLIYEAHVGMAQESGTIGTFNEFTENVLPRIKKLGYTAVQLMGIAEHPYYGSFGYHVSNFYAPSSRFGTPSDLKNLVRTAHEMGLAVIMDLVHSHFVKNYNEGLNDLDGSKDLYTVADDRRYQKYWDSMNFDYGKREVRKFLFSNIRYWMDEFHMDGFRFDGVTSMLYRNHGYQKFLSRDDYFNDNVNEDAVLYLTMANKLIHTINKDAVTIAEDVSGMPGLCTPIKDGGVGFDFRLGMAVPDFWIETIEDSGGNWDLGRLWYELNNRAPGVKTVAYCESHDQAMVGDKTIAFRLMGEEMYYSMSKFIRNKTVEDGVALHKMIRFITISAGGEAYLNFMGNEFGHPEWIDFPREGNGYSYDMAHRQWSLVEDTTLRYCELNEFDRGMISFVKKYKILSSGFASYAAVDNFLKVISYCHGDLLFIFNFNRTNEILAHKAYVPFIGEYELIFTTDMPEYGGCGREKPGRKIYTWPHQGVLEITMPPLCANVYKLKAD